MESSKSLPAVAGAETEMASEPPKDKYNLVYMIFVLLGLGFLFPWNAMISAPDYWSALYPNANAEFYLSMVYNWPNYATLIVLLFLGNRVNITLAMSIGFALDALALILIPLLDNNVAQAAVTLPLTYVFAGLMGLGTGLTSGLAFSYSSHFPPIYTQAVMGGNGVAGVIVAIIRIVTEAALPGQPRKSALIYFVLACAVCVATLIGFLLMRRLPFARYHLRRAGVLPAGDGESSERTPLVHAAHLSVNKADEAVADAAAQPHVLAVLRKVWRNGLAVTLVFFTTLALFPGVVTSVRWPTPSAAMQTWFPIILVSLFQLFDFVGRSLPRWFQLFNQRTIWIAVLARFAFFPLLVLCVKPMVLSHPAWPCAITSLLALTNGFTGSVGMMLRPDDLEPHEQGMAGVAMSLFLNTGILAGVNFGLAMARFVS